MPSSRKRLGESLASDSEDVEEEQEIEGPSYLPSAFVQNRFSVVPFLANRELGGSQTRKPAARDVALSREILLFHKQPPILRETVMGVNSWLPQYDKIFALHLCLNPYPSRASTLRRALSVRAPCPQTWLDSNTILAGTKCNRVLRLSLGAGPRAATVQEIPLPPCKLGRPIDAIENCGIHALAINPSRTRLLTGGRNPCDCAVLELGDAGIVPLSSFQGHTDWVFGMCWVTDDVFVTGSRDKSVAIWSASRRVRNSRPSRAAAIRLEHQHKVRDVRYSAGAGRVGTVSSDACLKLWDPNGLQLVQSCLLEPRPGPMRVEYNVVCLAMEQHVVAASSNYNVTLVDVRTSVSRPQAQQRLLEENLSDSWGVRSLSFKHNLLTIGGGSGKLYFADLRVMRLLPLESERAAAVCAAEARGADEAAARRAARSLRGMRGGSTPQDPLRGRVWHETGPGHFCMESGLFQEYAGNFNEEQHHHACYAHEWDAAGRRLATAGGPLPSGLRGCYAAVWEP